MTRTQACLSPITDSLPYWQAGAHIDVHTKSDIRQYSLCGPLDNTTTWRIAVFVRTMEEVDRRSSIKCRQAGKLRKLEIRAHSEIAVAFPRRDWGQPEVMGMAPLYAPQAKRPSQLDPTISKSVISRFRG
jgi:hypothetical protein